VNDLLARDRALSMRRLLVEGGIAADKLHMISSQAEYIASNSTVAGRAQNRRVDVLFANHAEDRTPVAMNEASSESGGTR
jgi:outer membrane protein OmpA-like peptidoglycan-associated protein